MLNLCFEDCVQEGGDVDKIKRTWASTRFWERSRTRAISRTSARVVAIARSSARTRTREGEMYEQFMECRGWK